MRVGGSSSSRGSLAKAAWATSGGISQKLNVEVAQCGILGACSPAYENRPLLAEDEVGAMLPCNVILRDKGDGKI